MRISFCLRHGRPHLRVLLSLSLCGLAALESSGQSVRTYQGIYRNETYTYEVVLPPGVIARGSAAPKPNHGFAVDLYVADKSAAVYRSTDLYLWVDGSYVQEDDVQSLDDAVDFSIRMMERSTGTKAQVVSKKEASLGGVNAMRVSLAFTVRGVSIVEEEVIAVRGAFMYTVGLQTTPKRKARDVVLFEKILSGFKFLPSAR